MIMSVLSCLVHNSSTIILDLVLSIMATLGTRTVLPSIPLAYRHLATINLTDYIDILLQENLAENTRINGCAAFGSLLKFMLCCRHSYNPTWSISPRCPWMSWESSRSRLTGLLNKACILKRSVMIPLQNWTSSVEKKHQCQGLDPQQKTD